MSTFPLLVSKLLPVSLGDSFPWNGYSWKFIIEASTHQELGWGQSRHCVGCVQPVCLCWAFVIVTPWWPSCASAKVCFQRLSGMTIRFSMLRSWPRTHSSSAKVLYIVPDKRLQSPEVTAWCTNCNVGSLADACSTCSSVSAACMTSLAKLKAYSVISTS